MGKIFRNRDFHFEIRFRPFGIDFDQKIRPKIFVLAIFTYDPFSKKMAMSPEKVITGKMFEIEIFILRYVLDHSESIPIKNFRPKIFVFAFFTFEKMAMYTEKSNNWKNFSKSR